MITKKKYLKTLPKYCSRHKANYCCCMIAGHRYWVSRKYYGFE